VRRLTLSLVLCLPALGLAAEQRTFSAPEQAVAALAEACASTGDTAWLALFGESHKHLVTATDPTENQALRSKACSALKAFSLLEESGADRRLLLIGEQAWPVPIPLVREQGLWRFATELAEEELISRRIGANERQAIAVLRAYLDAQRKYAATDRNNDGLLEYAQKLGSSAGQRDGLYWPADPAKGEEPSPFGPLVAASAEHFKTRVAGDPFHGYHFRILSRQGKNAPGGAFSYVINGHMLAGFALLAYPARYGQDGIMSFMVSNNGRIYQKNLGPKTTAVARAISSFDPDPSWQSFTAHE
jgi:hypothetical protein